MDLARHVLDDQQRERLPLHLEAAPRQVVALPAALHFHAEEAVGLAQQRLAQRSGGSAVQTDEVLALRRLALEEQLASDGIRVVDRTHVGEQDDRVRYAVAD